MHRLLYVPTCVGCLLFTASVARAADPLPAGEIDPVLIASAPADWPWWRGPNRNGVAAADQKPPLSWSETENIVWKRPVPGKGHGSPIVVGEHVYLQTMEKDRDAQSVLCFDRATGKLVWQTDVHKGNTEVKGNEKSTQANATPACDGERLYVNFLNGGAVYTTALTREGQQVWQTKITDYVLHQGFSSSPALYGPLVLVTADNKGGSGAVAGLERATGKIVWKQMRPKLPNYPSPIILKVAGKDQVFVQGCDLVTSFEPLTGKILWEIKGATEECVTSTPTDGTHIFTSGGYPRNHLAAIKADGSGKIAWENGSRVYVPSMIVRDGFLYATLDEGIAVCWQSDTGKEAWKKRLGGTFSSSMVLVGEHIFTTNEAGKTFVFKANPNEFELVGENQLGDIAFATPALCGGRIYHRVATQKEGVRQEWLYCLGKKGE